MLVKVTTFNKPSLVIIRFMSFLQGMVFHLIIFVENNNIRKYVKQIVWQHPKCIVSFRSYARFLQLLSDKYGYCHTPMYTLKLEHSGGGKVSLPEGSASPAPPGQIRKRTSVI